MFNPGDRANQYRIEASLGQGGQGVVYRASDLNLGRPVVLELLLGESKRNKRPFSKSPEHGPEVRVR